MSKKVYGIDLGTTNSCIATLDNSSNPKIISDEMNASDTLASAIHVTKDNKFLVGAAAKEEAVTNPDTTFQFWKRYIGRTDIPNMPTYQANGKSYDPVSLSQIVLEKIAEYAKASGETVEDVVITCPAYFDFGQREATKQAGQLAGLNVLAVINEPTAAALYYCANRFAEQNTKVLVYDLGGGTFDVSIIQVRLVDGVRHVDVLATDGDFMLGGYDWDMILYNLILEKYAEQYGISVDDMDDELKREFRGLTEGTKQKLSRKDNVNIRLSYEGDRVQVEVTREEFEARTRAKLDQSIKLMDKALKDAGCSDDDLDIVLMVGGSTLMPQVQNMLYGRFGDKVQFNEPALAVAKGAALTAGMMIDDSYQGGGNNRTDKGGTPELPTPGGDGDSVTTKTTNIVLHDVSPRSFGLGILDENGEYICDNIVKMDEVIPCDRNRVYATPRDNMRNIRLRLFQSKSKEEWLKPCVDSLGEEQHVDPALDMKVCDMLTLEIPEGFNLPTGTEVFVDFSIDEACTVRIRATVPDANNTTKDADFSFYKKLTQEDLDQAAEDRKNRVFVDGD